MPHKDPEAAREYRRQYYLKNRAERLAYQKARREQNPEKEDARAREWALANPERRKKHQATYAAKPEAKAKAAARSRAWREANPERGKEIERAHELNRVRPPMTEDQREKRRERKAAQRAENRAAERVRARTYRQANREKYAASEHRRRARTRLVGWDAELTEFVIREAVLLCAARRGATGVSWEVDHFYPLAGRRVTGLHVWSNIRVITAYANRRKSNRAPRDGEPFFEALFSAFATA
ncbi:MAG: hypothetical protein AB7S63_14540 [Thauera sp.]